MSFPDYQKISFIRSFRQYKVVLFQNSAAKFWYGAFPDCQFFLHLFRFECNKFSSLLYKRNAILRQSCDIGDGAGNRKIVLFAMFNASAKLFSTGVNGYHIRKFQSAGSIVKELNSLVKGIH